MPAEVPTQPPDSDEVKAALDAIDFETAEVRSAHRGSGWTAWGVLAALAAVAWLLADLVKTETVSQIVVLRLFFLGSVSVDIVVGLAALFGIQYPLFPGRDEKRLPMGTGVQLNGLEVLLMLGRSAILWWVVASGWPEVSSLIRAIAYVYVAMSLPLILLALTMRALAFTRPVGASRGMVRVQALVGVTVLLLPITILALYGPAFFQGTYAAVADYQLAGLLVAVSFLLGRLARLYRHAPALGPLLEIRRDLVFSRITPGEALRRVESTVIGKTGAECVPEEVERFRTRLKGKKAYGRAMRAADALAAKYRTEDGNPGVVPEAEVEKWRKSSLRRWSRELRVMKWRFKWLKVRLAILTQGDSEAGEAADREVKRLVVEDIDLVKPIVGFMDRRMALLGETRPTESAPPDKDSS